MTGALEEPPIPLGARVHIGDQDYSGVAIVLQYDPYNPDGGPYYCHLVELCDHDLCESEDDDCMGEECRGWYAIDAEAPPLDDHS